MARHGNEGKTKRRRNREGDRDDRESYSSWIFNGTYYSQYKKQLLRTAEPLDSPGSSVFRQWHPPRFQTKIAYLVHYYKDRPKDEWLSPDLIKKCFHPIQTPLLWRKFRSARQYTRNEVQVCYDRLQNMSVRSRRAFCKELMVLALFGHPGDWMSELRHREGALRIRSEEAAQVDEAACQETRGRKREWYYWWELEKMFGQLEAHELMEKGEFEKKKLKYGDDVYHYRRLTDVVKLRMQDTKRQQDEKYHIIQEARKLSEEAERLCTELNLRLSVVHAQASLNGELLTEPPDIRKIKVASEYLSDLYRSIDIDFDV